MATDLQVQKWADEHTRPRANAIHELVTRMELDLAQIEDVYNTLNVQNPTWKDNRTDGPPHLLLPTDVLAIHSFIFDICAAMKAHGQYPVVLKAIANP